MSGAASSHDAGVHTTNIIAAVIVPVAVLALVAVALATAYRWRRKAGASPPGSAKGRDMEAGTSDKPGERYHSGVGPFPGHAGADATIAGIVEMGRAKDSASSVAGHGADGVACLSTTNGSYTGAYGSLIGTAEHPSPPSVAGSDRPLLYGMGPLRSASYLLAARNSTDDAQFPLPDEEFFMAPLPALDTWRSASGSGAGAPGGSDDSGSDWFIRPEDVIICKDPRGNDWQLGSGAYGSVYKGMLQGSTSVAVKFVRGHSPKEQARFRNEVGILKSLRHTNVVQFLGASPVPGQIMLVTEYLPRGDLWRALSKDSQHVFSWYRRGRQITLDVVRGLHHMHSRKVMHLDLKSANILLARDGTAKIADVGLAKILTRDNTCVSTEGTFDWAAPEVLSGLECSEKADIWSLGVVLWEVVTGERPHMRQLRELRVPEECPAEVDRVISACRLVDPSARPTALDVYNAIFRSPTAPPPGVSLSAGTGAAAAAGLERTSSGAASASAAASAQYTTGDRAGSAELAAPRAADAGVSAHTASSLSAGPWSAGNGVRADSSGAPGAGLPASPPPAAAAAPAPPEPGTAAAHPVAEAGSRADAGAGAPAVYSAGEEDSGERQPPAGAAAAPASTPFADAAGAAFGDAGRAGSEGSAEGPTGALGGGAQPSARRPELDPFDIAAHSAVPPGALTPAASSKPSTGSPPKGPSTGAGAGAGSPAGGLVAQSEAPLDAPSGSPAAAPAAERPRPPTVELGEGASPPPVEGVVRVTSSEFSPLGAGRLGQAAALKRGPSPPPAVPRQAVH